MTTTAPNPYSAQELAAAQQYGVNPAWYSALINVESSNNPGATSPAGAQGLSQLMPGTAASVGVTNPLDPQQSLTGGANYFSQMLKAAGGNYQTATMYYNCGPGQTCPAGQAEASAVQDLYTQNGGTGNAALDTMNATAAGIANGTLSPLGNPINQNNPLAVAVSGQNLPSLSTVLSKGSIIAVGALLIILAMVIPNRTMVMKMVK